MQKANTIMVAALLSLASHPTPVLADGKVLYESLCQTCHGATGMGDGPGVPTEAIRPRPFKANVFKFDTDMDWQKGTDSDLKAVIQNGPAEYGGSNLMPPWPGLTDHDLDELIAYIRTLQ